MDDLLQDDIEGALRFEFTEHKVSGDEGHPPEVNGYTLEQVHYHVGLCNEAGYLNGRCISGADFPYSVGQRQPYLGRE